MKRFLSCLRVQVAIALIIGIGSVGGLVAYANAGAPFRGWLSFNNGHAQVPYQDEINLNPANGSFTIEGWLNSPDYYARYVIYKPYSFLLYLDNQETNLPFPGTSKCEVIFSSCGNDGWCGGSAHVLSSGTSTYFCPHTGWVHFAYVYNQATNKGALFWNGQLLGSDERIPNVSTEPIKLGGMNIASQSSQSDLRDEFRISNNVRYTTSFTPPSAPFECDANTLALWHFDEIAGSTSFHDACGAVDNMLVGTNDAHTEGVTSSWIYLPLVVR